MDHPDYLVSGDYDDMVQDSQGIIWIGANETGVWSFDPVAESFKHYLHEPGNSNSVSDDGTTSITVDKKGKVWIANYKGLDELDPRTENFKHFYHLNGDSSTISNSFVKRICTDDDDNLWIVTAAPGIDYFNSLTGKMIHHFNYGSTEFSTDKACSVSSGKNNNIWIGSTMPAEPHFICIIRITPFD